jgi:hypothetical protein
MIVLLCLLLRVVDLRTNLMLSPISFLNDLVVINVPMLNINSHNVCPCVAAML